VAHGGDGVWVRRSRRFSSVRSVFSAFHRRGGRGNGGVLAVRATGPCRGERRGVL